MAGLTNQGFERKLLTQIEADVAARQKQASAIGPNQDTSAHSALGQLNGTFAAEVSELWELAELVHASNDPDGALDISLVNIAAISGTVPRAATASRILGVTLNIEPGEEVPAGSLASVAGRPDLVFSLDEAGENAGMAAADFLGDFTCTQLGPIVVNANTLTVIDTPVSGWNTVNNLAAAVPGNLADTSLTLRERREAQLALRGGSTIDALRADLLDSDSTPELVTVEAVIVLENVGPAPDLNGLPPHSIECIIDDGPVPSVDNDVLAQVIWEGGKATGIRAYGSETGIAKDAINNDQIVGFSRVTRLPIYIVATVTTSDSFPVDGLEQVAAAWVARGGAYDVSEDVVALFVRAAAFEVAGVVDVPTFTIGIGPAPVDDDNIAIGYRERATFSVDTITVTE